MKDCTVTMSEYHEKSFNNVFVIVAFNDCDSETSITDILSIYAELLNQAKRVAVSGVLVSSILPRLAGATT